MSPKRISDHLSRASEPYSPVRDLFFRLLVEWKHPPYLIHSIA
jgi:hypothetical protein